MKPVMKQIGLFLDAKAPPPLAHLESDRRLAARLSPRVLVGPSTWTFPGWAGIVYPPGTAREELVDQSRALAAKLGFERMSFFNLSVSDASVSDLLPPQVDIVTALHACDTATDDAIQFGLRKRAKFMVLVPCCQAEMARALNANKALSLGRTPLAELWRHPLHAREMGSQLTNVLRCLYLEASGYQVTVTELVGWEHSMKNELIIARHTGHRQASSAKRLAAILDEFGLGDAIQSRFRLQ